MTLAVIPNRMTGDNITYQPLRRYIGSLIGNMEQEQGKYMLKPGFEEISRFFEHFRQIWAPGGRLWALTSFVDTNLTRRIDPRYAGPPENTPVKISTTCDFLFLSFFDHSKIFCQNRSHMPPQAKPPLRKWPQMDPLDMNFSSKPSL